MNTFSHYMYRSPLLSIIEFKELQRNDLSDRDYLIYLIKYIERKKLYASIYSSSKSLYYSLINFDDTTSEKKTKNILISLYKYLIRMAFRATPFGMYSGVGINHINAKHKSKESYTYYGYLNNNVIYQLIDAIHNDISLLNKIDIWNNPNIYTDNKHIFLPYQVNYAVHEIDSIDNVSLKKNELVETVMDICSNKTNFSNLKSLLCEKFNAPEETVVQYLQKLIKEDFLMTDFKINLSNKSAFESIINKLDTMHEYNNLINIVLKKLKFILNEIKITTNNTDILKLLKQADTTVKKILPNFKENTINIDTKISGRNIELTVDDMKNIEFLATLSSKLSIFEPSKVLESFKNKFSEYYGQDEDVQLSRLLNSSTGLGIPDEYTTPINLNSLNKANNIAGILENWKTEALIKGLKSIELTDKKINELRPLLMSENIHTSFDMFFTKIGNGNKLYLKNNSGSLQAGQTYGRFTYMFDNEIRNNISDFYNKQHFELESSEVIYNHPNPKIQNVMTSIIPNNIIDFVNTEKCTNINDLYIFLGEDFNFYIRNKQTQKLIYPEFNNMHNTNLSPSIIRFLSDIGMQYHSGTYFLSYFATEHAYSPRLEYKNIVLSPQKWNINFEKGLSYDKFNAKLNEFGEKFRLDNQFYVINEDHKLFIDINYGISRRILYSEYKKREVLEIEEVEDELITASSPYINELVFSFSYSLKPNLINLNSLPPKEIRDKKEVILPGNNWLCVNLYYNKYNFDSLMSNGLFEKIFKHINEEENIETSFFIRYFDTQEHLRLRFKIKNSNTVTRNKLLALLNSFKSESFINTFNIVPYLRETYRYGGEECIDLAEKCFEIDSVIVTKYYSDLMSEFDKIDFAIDNILQILHFFRSTIEGKIDLLKVFGKNKEVKELYRTKRNRIFSSINNNTHYLNSYNIANFREKYYQNYYKKLKKVDKIEDDFIVLSIIHMFCNRLFGTDRAIESKVLEIIYRALIDYKKIKNK